MNENKEVKNENQNNLNSIKEMLEFYKDNLIPAHIVLKINRRFYNGNITKIQGNIFIITDNKLGPTPIRINEVFLIENFHEPPNGGKEKCSKRYIKPREN